MEQQISVVSNAYKELFGEYPSETKKKSEVVKMVLEGAGRLSKEVIMNVIKEAKEMTFASENETFDISEYLEVGFPEYA